MPKWPGHCQSGPCGNAGPSCETIWKIVEEVDIMCDARDQSCGQCTTMHLIQTFVLLFARLLTLLIWLPASSGHSRNSRGHWKENLMRALNTSLKCCLPSTDAIDRYEKMHACLWRFKVASCKRTSLKSTRFSQKKNKIGYSLGKEHDNGAICPYEGVKHQTCNYFKLLSDQTTLRSILHHWWNSLTRG